MLVHHFMLLLLAVGYVDHVQAKLLSAGDFLEGINSIGNTGLGIYTMQEYLDTEVEFTRASIDGATLIDQLADSLQEKFSDRFKLVADLKQNIEAQYSDYSDYSDYSECCNAAVTEEYDIRFKGEVDVHNLCVRKSLYTEAGAKYATKGLLTQFLDNSANVPGVKWQYFGTETGLLFSYPAQLTDDCQNYDPRFRPWYVQTITPQPKDVVIILDKSGSMKQEYNGQSLMDIAKEAALAVLGTLNTNDRLGLVSFSDEAETVYGGSDLSRECFSEELAYVIPQNKRLFGNFIKDIIPRGATYYGKALEKAFDLFGNTPSVNDTESADRQKLILFLTDGDPTDRELVLTTLEEKNTQSNYSVSILAYGIGGMTQLGQNILTSMVASNVNKPGKFVMITDVSNLRKEMASFYKFFSQSKIAVPKVSAPYFDAFGLGLVVTISLPIYYKDSFTGVVGIDITLADLFSEVNFLQRGLYSYAFVIDREGFTLSHPLIPRPTDVKDDPVQMSVTTLEYQPEAQAVVADMMAGGSGHDTFLAVRLMPKGDPHRQGLITMTSNSTYYWKQVPGTEFSVCIVVGYGDEQPVPSLKSAAPQVPFLYHRLDLENPIALCKHFSRLAVRGTTVVKFGPRAFSDPFYYLDMKEDDYTLKRMSDIIHGTGTTSTMFKDGVRASVVTTAKVHDLWFSTSMEDVQYSVWRYIATLDGVIRISPGTSLHKNYEPTARDWFRASVAAKTQKVLSAPYLDAFGAGYVITLSQALFEGSGQSGTLHSDNDTVVGVMGIDFTVSYFYSMLISKYTQCQTPEYSCFVVDKAGYIVVHQEFVDITGVESPIVENIHITVKEKGIANYLISNNYMVKRSCTNVYEIRAQEYYEITLSSTIENMGGTPSFEMEQIPLTNIYLAIQKVDTSSPSCDCTDRGSSTPPACSPGESACQCPCHSHANFHYCRNYFYDIQQLCTPASSSLNMTANVLEEFQKIQELNWCYDPKCLEKTSKGECYSVAGCGWCERDREGQHLDEPYCDEQQVCYFGQIDFQSPYDYAFDFDLEGLFNSLSETLLVGYIGGPLAALVAVITAIYKWCKCCKRRPARQPAGGIPLQGTQTSQPVPAVPAAPVAPAAPAAPAPYPPHEGCCSATSNMLHHLCGEEGIQAGDRS